MDQPEGFLFLHCSEFREWAYWRVKDISMNWDMTAVSSEEELCPPKSRHTLEVYIPRMADQILTSDSDMPITKYLISLKKD